MTGVMTGVKQSKKLFSPRIPRKNNRILKKDNRIPRKNNRILKKNNRIPRKNNRMPNGEDFINLNSPLPKMKSMKIEGKIETFTEQFHKPQLSLPKMKINKKNNDGESLWDQIPVISPTDRYL